MSIKNVIKKIEKLQKEVFTEYVLEENSNDEYFIGVINTYYQVLRILKKEVKE